MKVEVSYQERLDRLPPYVCRIIARVFNRNEKPLRPLTYRDIARRSGLAWGRVAWIAKQTTWAQVTVSDADAFRRGCGILPGNEWRHVEYVKRSFNPAVTQKPLRHLDGLSAKQQRRLMKLFAAGHAEPALQEQTNPS